MTTVLSVNAAKYLDLARQIVAALKKDKVGKAFTAEEAAKKMRGLLSELEPPVYFCGAK